MPQIIVDVRIFDFTSANWPSFILRQHAVAEKCRISAALRAGFTAAFALFLLSLLYTSFAA